MDERGRERHSSLACWGYWTFKQLEVTGATEYGSQAVVGKEDEWVGGSRTESWDFTVREPGLYSVTRGILKGFKIGKREDETCVPERSLLAKYLCFLV